MKKDILALLASAVIGTALAFAVAEAFIHYWTFQI